MAVALRTTRCVVVRFIAVVASVAFERAAALFAWRRSSKPRGQTEVLPIDGAPPSRMIINEEFKHRPKITIEFAVVENK